MYLHVYKGQVDFVWTRHPPPPSEKQGRRSPRAETRKQEQSKHMQSYPVHCSQILHTFIISSAATQLAWKTPALAALPWRVNFFRTQCAPRVRAGLPTPLKHTTVNMIATPEAAKAPPVCIVEIMSLISTSWSMAGILSKNRAEWNCICCTDLTPVLSLSLHPWMSLLRISTPIYF